MSNDLRVATPPPKPLLIYDGECGFCRRWVGRWQRATGDKIAYAPSQDEAVARQFPEIPAAAFAQSVQLILPDGSVYNGAEAVFRSLAEGGRERWLLWCYRKIHPFADLTELIYDEVAAHREFISKVDRFVFGPEIAPRPYALVQYAFLRGLGLIYLIAFVSLWMQIQGLIGSNGIVPAQALMGYVKQNMADNHVGVNRYHVFPTLAWWSASDQALDWQCKAGVGLSVLLILGIAPAPVLFLLWLIYLSLATIAPPFLNFQWDTLLLEAGFLAIFFAPLKLWERPGRQGPPSRIAVWLLRWLLFRLMFESGCVKLMSGDATWWNLTALRVHYETQPLPTWIGWYVHQWPPAVHGVCAAIMFIIELVVPWFIFCGRKARMSAAAIFALFQVVILLTGNYTFFNLLTILLCVVLLDDDFLKRFVPQRFCPRLPCPGGIRWPWKILAPVALAVGLMTALTLPLPTSLTRSSPRLLLGMYLWFEPFRSFNGYGLFANMTQKRAEIIVEGSDDGQSWQEYEFKYKPGDLKRKPTFIAPFQPRLDWQMWFAALGRPEQNPWFLRFEYQLLRNAPPVVALLKHNPFPKDPPKYIRAQLYEYHFTDRATRKATGQWWRREYKGPYLPALSISDFGIAPSNG